MKKFSVLSLALASTLSLALAGCSSAAGPDEAATDESGEYPLTIMNCGKEVILAAPPERVVLLDSSPVTFLHLLDVMDRVVARAGTYPSEYYDADTQAEIDRIPLLTDKLDTSGHLQISQEVVMAQEPDLVLGTAEGMNRETLAASGIPLLEEPSFCPDPPSDADFADIGDQMETYARAFGMEERGIELAQELDDRVQEISLSVPEGEKRTAAVLYPTVGGGVTYAYGTGSMAHPQLEAAGFTNVFADEDQRVFEVSREELIGRDPDVLILLHSAGDPTEISSAITSLRGAQSITAVANDDVMVQLFNFTEPASPLSILGLEHIIERFEQ
ncbi:ABC transporter substrate-binding protein [Arthrobacter echini]|uniref:ABC transporter substrate-binding protein n=1 Tax=Arthrobacter echini TaxID=1529066 RepID=UPI001FE52806|nr:ABC transporter substrate-binding protein [Arthrobacter echini]